MQAVRLFPYCISHQNLAAVPSHPWPDSVTAIKVVELAGAPIPGMLLEGLP
jgi:hypothetical protein